MTTTRLQLADAMVTKLTTALAAAEITGVTVVRRNIPLFDPEQLQATTICVTPGGRNDEPDTTETNSGGRELSIAIMRHLPQPENDSPDGFDGNSLDALVNLVDQIGDLWDIDGEMRDEIVAGLEWESIDLAIPLNFTLLRELRIFQAVFTLTYGE